MEAHLRGGLSLWMYNTRRRTAQRLLEEKALGVGSPSDEEKSECVGQVPDMGSAFIPQEVCGAAGRGPAGESRVPEPPKWDPTKPSQWKRSILAWANIYALACRRSGGDVDEDLLLYVQWAVSEDARASRLLASSGACSFLEVVDLIVSGAAGRPVNDAQETYDRINGYRINNGESLKASWMRYKGLIMEAAHLDVCPPELTLSMIYYRALQASKFREVAVMMRFCFPDRIQIPWNDMRMRMDKLADTWDFDLTTQEEKGPRILDKRRSCHLCKKYGHFAKECPNQPLVQVNAVKMSGTGSDRKDVEMLVDTGAGSHVFGLGM